jgi:hypothetical protein
MSSEALRRQKEDRGRYSTDQLISTRGNLLALKLMIDCNESKFAVFREEPTIMQLKSMEERSSNIEFR